MLRHFIILCLALTLASANVIDLSPAQFVQQLQNRFQGRLQNRFRDHLAKHAKKYINVTEEFIMRRQQNFLENLDLIERHNKENKHGFKLGSNEYSDRHRERFVQDMCRTEQPANTRALAAVYPPTTPAKLSVNWNAYAQPIVNQGGCGSCWAFAAIAVIEYYNAIRGKWRLPISQQNLVDCDPYDNACNGGWPATAFNYLKNNYNNRIARAVDYPYTSGTTKVRGVCRAVSIYTPLNYVSTFSVRLNGNEALLRSYVSNYGPVAIAMYVSNSGLFQNYRGGVFYDSTCPRSTATFDQCSQVNHGMVAVGYGTDPITGARYWLVRNSWGTTWGEGGYIRMAMDRGNNCNVACWAMGIE